MRGCFLTLLAVGGCPSFLFAATPRIIVDTDPPNPTAIVSQNFSFSADGLGGGDFSFQNASGVYWHELLFTATLPDFTAITCGPGPFVTCTIATTAETNGFLYSIMFGPTAAGGIPNSGLFSINLNDSGTEPGGSGSWGSGNGFSARANDVAPEPSSFWLALAGLLAFGAVAFRRHLTNALRIAS